MKIMPLDVAGKTDCGKVRERNEDSLSLEPELGLLVVADGMGGHNSGEVASGLATDTIVSFGRQMLGRDKEVIPAGGDQALSVRAQQVVHFIQSANTVIYEKSKAHIKNQGMGTTVVAVLGDSGSISVGHVGDSRLYRLRDNVLEQLTEDHSLVNEQVKSGQITKEQADKSNLQNILTRALGTEPVVQVEVHDHPVQDGDILLICSDGLTKMVSDADVAEVLATVPEPIDAVDRLIEMANAAGGVDNVTVVVARTPREPAERKGFFSKLIGG